MRIIFVKSGNWQIHIVLLDAKKIEIKFDTFYGNYSLKLLHFLVFLKLYRFPEYSSSIPSTMGKRKSKRKPPTKRKAIEPLDTQFNCKIN